MRASEHIVAGVITSAITYLAASAALGQRATPAGLLTAGILGIPAGVALDLAEPAIHPHHRGPAHSTLAFAGLVALAQKVWSDPTSSPAAKIWMLVTLAGIGSHHVLDSTTSRGLPLTGLGV